MIETSRNFEREKQQHHRQGDEAADGNQLEEVSSVELDAFGDNP